MKRVETIKVELVLTDREIELLLSNSIERVLNTSRRLLEKLHADERDEDGWINQEDLKLLSPIVRNLWASAYNATYQHEVDRTKEGECPSE